MTGCTSRYLMDSVGKSRASDTVKQRRRNSHTLILGKSAFSIPFFKQLITKLSHFACYLQSDFWVLDVLVLIIGEVFIDITVG
jgi:hypothetical protein